MSYKKEFPLWILAFLAAAIPFVATHLAWLISIKNAYVPMCIPYLDGCTSISRSARHGLANDVFKVMMIPAAVIQVLSWFACRIWIKQKKSNAARSLPVIAIISGIFLIMYVVFLGTEGPIYQLLRRYGITVYFGMTYIGQLVVDFNMKIVAKGILPKIMKWITFSLFPIALLGLYFSLTTWDTVKNDEIENVIEWNLSLLMMIWFALLSLVWKKQRLTTAEFFS